MMIQLGKTYSGLIELTEPEGRAFLVLLVASAYETEASYTPRVRLSRDTGMEYPWYLRVTSRVARSLEQKGLCAIRVVQIGERYEQRADVSLMGSSAIDHMPDLCRQVQEHTERLREVQRKSNEAAKREGTS